MIFSQINLALFSLFQHITGNVCQYLFSESKKFFQFMFKLHLMYMLKKIVKFEKFKWDVGKMMNISVVLYPELHL